MNPPGKHEPLSARQIALYGVGAVVTSILIEVTAHYLESSAIVSRTTSQFMTLCATVLFLIVPSIVVFRSVRSLSIRLTAGAGTLIFILYNSVIFVQKLLPELNMQYRTVSFVLEAASLFAGLGLLILAFCFALAEMLRTQAELQSEKERLLEVIAERDQAARQRDALETQLRQAAKMESVGRLAGGIAHDFNNILTAILGYAQLAHRHVDGNSRAQFCVEQIWSAGERARDLISQILAFSRKSDLERRPIDLPQLLREALKMLRGSIPPTVEIRSRINEECRPVLGDPTGLHQVIVNLCTNAYHAMRDMGGFIDVELDEVLLDERMAGALHDMQPGPHVRLVIADSGCGMDEATTKHVFDPYFTTKKLGEGTGLGLSVVHGIIQELNGAVRVESAVGKGTRFEVFIPVCLAAAQDRGLPAQASHEALDGTERVLVVDDEVQILTSVQMALGDYGYSVETCSDPREALERFRADPDRYDIVITDQAMPYLMGIQLVEELLQVRPGLPIILCTGYSDALDEERVKEWGVREFVRKPVLPSVLIQTLRKALDRDSDPAS